MKQQPNHTLSNIRLLAVVALLLATTLACQFLTGTATPPPPDAPNAPDTPAQPGQPDKPGAPTRVEGAEFNGELVGPGEFRLQDPAVGLDGLDGYTQIFDYTLEATFEGKAYSAATHIERSAAGADWSATLKDEHTGAEPMALLAYRLGGVLYGQDSPDLPCRASEDASRPDPIPSPTDRLPAVYGAEETGRETYEGREAVVYSFDERAVRYQAGQTGTAQGEVWIDAQSGAVLKFDLTVEGAEPPSKQTWAYRLTLIGQAEVARLPEGCNPLPLDIPIAKGAVDLIRKPGFLRYSVPGGPQDAADFYRQSLPAAGWLALPEGDPEGDLQVLRFTFNGEEGSKVAILTITAAEGGAQVVAQVMKLKDKVNIDPMDDPANLPEPMEPAEPMEPEEPVEAEEPANPDTPAMLPDDLPVYPGASGVMDSGFVLMYTAPAEVEKVAEFYEEQMTADGWTLTDSLDVAPTIMQTWEKAGAKVMLVVSKQTGTTQVMVTNAE